MVSDQYDAGLTERTEVLGPEYVERALAGADNFNRDFQQIVTEYCWGGTWGRGVLERKKSCRVFHIQRGRRSGLFRYSNGVFR